MISLQHLQTRFRNAFYNNHSVAKLTIFFSIFQDQNNKGEGLCDACRNVKIRHAGDCVALPRGGGRPAGSGEGGGQEPEQH